MAESLPFRWEYLFYFSHKASYSLGSQFSLRASWWQGQFCCWSALTLCCIQEMECMVWLSLCLLFIQNWAVSSCTFNHVRITWIISASFHDPRPGNQLIEISVPCLGNWFCELCVTPYFSFSFFIFLNYIGCCGWVLHLCNQTWLGILTLSLKQWVSLSLPVTASSSRKMRWLPLGLQ